MAPQTVDLPVIAFGEVHGPTFAQPQTIDLPVINFGRTFAPHVVRANEPAVQVLVNGTPIADASERVFQEDIADVGSFAFSKLREDFTGVDYGDLITYKLDGVPRFLGVVEKMDHTVKSPQERADQIVRVGGRGALAEWARRRVRPSRPLGSVPIELIRSWSWVGNDFDPPWGQAKITNLQREYASWRTPVPAIYPDTSGYWIGPNRADSTATNGPLGATLYAGEFTLDEDCEMVFFGAGDNSLQAYLDGGLFMENLTYRTAKVTPPIEMSAGVHKIRARGNNYPKAVLPNPGNIIMAGYKVGDAGLLTELVFHTDASWQALYIGSGTPPTFNHGQVLIDLYTEGNLAALGWALDFDEHTDSAGRPWTQHREITVNVGRSSHLDTILEMSDSDIDVHAAPGAKVLRAYNRGTRGVVRSSTLQFTTNPDTSDFLALSHAGMRPRVNRFLIRYAGGWTEVEDAASITANGVYEDYLELGAVQSEAEAKRVGRVLMETRKDAAHSTSAILHPRRGTTTTTPYKPDGFEVADWVNCPDETDTPESMRVMSISMSEDANGKVDWPVRLRQKKLDDLERHEAHLRQMVPGVVNGARVASRAGDQIEQAQTVNVLDVAEFSYDNTALQVSQSQHRPASVTANLVEIFGELTTAGSTTTTVVVDRRRYGGSWSTLGTLTFAAGETEAETALSVEPIFANVDKLRTRITGVGTGAEGLDVQVRGL